MIVNMICTILIVIWMVANFMYSHKTFKNKYYDRFYIVYLVIIFTIFQVLIWIVF